MSHRLQRMIELARRTGDTIMVHDAVSAHDLVVMPFEQYEQLLDREGIFDSDEYLLEDMSEVDLINKINRDIAVWRSYQELNEHVNRVSTLEEQLVAEPPPDPFEEDFSHHTEWHQVGEVLKARRGLSSSAGEREDVEGVIGVPDELTKDTPSVAESVTYQSVDQHGAYQVPVLRESESEVILGPEEDLSDDEPVFFEEPTS